MQEHKITEHYFTKSPKSRLVESEIDVVFMNERIKLVSASGIFSKSKQDFATRFLSESAFSFIPIKGRVLDLGCGNGALSIPLAVNKKNCDFLLSDVNERAVKIALKNIKRLGLKNCKAVQSDLFENIDNELFDVILSNPPMATKKEFREKMVKESFDHLNPKGMLMMVANNNKGGKMIKGYIESYFGSCEVISKKNGFWVYLGRRE